MAPYGGGGRTVRTLHRSVHPRTVGAFACRRRLPGGRRARVRRSLRDWRRDSCSGEACRSRRTGRWCRSEPWHDQGRAIAPSTRLAPRSNGSSAARSIFDWRMRALTWSSVSMGCSFLPIRRWQCRRCAACSSMVAASRSACGTAPGFTTVRWGKRVGNRRARESCIPQRPGAPVSDCE